MQAPYPPPALRAEHVAQARLFANRVDALGSWPKGAHVAELGVAYGGFTDKILRRTEPARFDAFDLFRLHELEKLWNRPTTEIFEGKTQRRFYEDRFADEVASGRLRTFEGDSSAGIAARPPESYDVIYIDGDHSYPGVMKDAEAAIGALKPGGILVFNDYVLYDKTGGRYGVVPVVNALCVEKGWRVFYLALNREMFCDIALVRG
jgi:SAM-dependent methyltransferase